MWSSTRGSTGCSGGSGPRPWRAGRLVELDSPATRAPAGPAAVGQGIINARGEEKSGMFGHEKKILEQGAQTQGVVTDVSKQMQGGLNSDGGRSVWAYSLSIDVRFDDDSTLPLWVKRIRPHDLQISESGWDAINEKIVVSEWDAIDDKIVVGAV